MGPFAGTFSSGLFRDLLLDVLRQEADQPDLADALESLQRQNLFEIQRPQPLGHQPAEQGAGLVSLAVRHAVLPADACDLPGPAESMTPAERGVATHRSVQAV